MLPVENPTAHRYETASLAQVHLAHFVRDVRHLTVRLALALCWCRRRHFPLLLLDIARSHLDLGPLWQVVPALHLEKVALDPPGDLFLAVAVEEGFRERVPLGG